MKHVRQKNGMRASDLCFIMITLILMCATVTLSASCSLNTKNTLCKSKHGTLVCPPGWGCSRDQTECVQTCGDDVIGTDEGCDDGNTRDGDGCDRDCTPTGCGNNIITEGEQCDGDDIPLGAPSGSSCSQFCILEYCGNDVKDPLEQCDSGELNSDSGFCTLDCKSATCGDGKLLNGFESCDNGKMNSETAACLNDCQSARCGDLKIQAGVEECDDGDENNNGLCPYGPRTACQACNSSCYLQNSPARFCGDGQIETGEVCDDGNDASCGTCSSDCHTIRISNASGEIKIASVSQIRDGDTFAIYEHVYRHEYIQYEFDSNDVLSNASNIQIKFTASDTVDVLLLAIGEKLGTVQLYMHIIYEYSNERLVLKHFFSGIQYNRDIIQSGNGLSIRGMSGGGGSDCGPMIDCKYDLDCVSGYCRNGKCL
jgi:cysteine-rich repeat protein